MWHIAMFWWKIREKIRHYTKTIRHCERCGTKGVYDAFGGKWLCWMCWSDESGLPF